MIGQMLGAKYRIEKKLGSGSFGDVYRALHTQLEKSVAIKILSGGGEHAKRRESFLRESRNMAKLTHPNVATVFDVGEHEGQPYIVMEFVEGLSLSERIEESELDLLTVLAIAIQVGEAMRYVHEHGIIHHDLSLKNIMLTERGEVKIVDFGLSKQLHAESDSGRDMIRGTLFYIAPEQVRGEGIDARGDIFSFGVGLYRLLCGRFPFEAEHAATLLYRIAYEEPAPLAPEIPGPLAEVVLRSLVKDRAARYQSFSEIVARIAGVAKELRGVGPEPSTETVFLRPRAEPPTQRNPYLNRVMIKNPADFYGRSREIAKIFSRLDAGRPQSISVVGERRMGKSSLLNFVYQRRNRRLQMQNHASTLFVYIDCQGREGLDVPRFIDMLMGMVNFEERREIAPPTEPRTLDGLKAVVERLNTAGKRLVVLIDEFDAVTGNPRFESSFFSYLRSLANNYRVAFVTASIFELQQMCHDESIATSPFFNIFTNLPLRVFSPDEAMELIRGPSDREGIPLAGHAARLVALAGHFPLFLQIACSSAFEHLADRKTGAPEWREIAAAYKDEAWPHYRFIWEKMDESARGYLARVASDRRPDAKLQYVGDDLARRGYLVESDGRWRAFSETFCEFVLESATKRR